VGGLSLPWHGKSSSELWFSDDLKPEEREQSESKVSLGQQLEQQRDIT
jgi:hypothetical protein